MIRRWIFLFVLIILGVLLFYNPNFKTISTGVAILLFGMVTLEQGFKVFTKGPLKEVLRKATDKLYKSISIGALVTAFIQSSSLVSVITISFISAGLITLSGGIGLIFGANIGTTATAWLVAGFGLKVNISALAMPMLIFGIIFSFQRSTSLKGLGNVLAGLGFFFLGIHFMKEGFDVFSDHMDLTEYAVGGWLGVIVYTGIGIVITTILQSSSASLALILTALSAGQIEYENALALAIGTNIGTTITALIGSIGSNIAGKRLAIAHLIFNLVTGIVTLLILFPLARLVNQLAELLLIDNHDYTLKLALFHTIFNIMGVLIMIPFIKKLERFLLRVIKEPKDHDLTKPVYLNKTSLEFPSTLINSLEAETKHLFENSLFEIVAHALNLHRSEIASDVKAKKLASSNNSEIPIDIREIYIQKVKIIYGKILEYATKGQAELTLEPHQVSRIMEIKLANRKMVEIIRDVNEMRRNLSKYSHSENEYIRLKYSSFRRMIIKTFRTIYKFRNEEDKAKHRDRMAAIRKRAKKKSRQGSNTINSLIRENLVSPYMASSLVNDHDNIQSIIKKLIEVGELIYSDTDPLHQTESLKAIQ